MRNLAAAFFLSTVAFSQSYTVSVIAPPSGIPITVGLGSFTGINNSGQVSAKFITPGVNSESALIGSPSGSYVIPLPAGFARAEGNAINNLGQVAGTVYTAGGSTQAFIGTASSVTVIPLPSGWTSAWGNAINDSGQVVGYGINPAGNQQAFIGSGSGSSAIPLPPGWTNSIADGINSSGLVTGEVSHTANSPEQAFIGTASSISVIPLAGGGAMASGLGINDSGQVCGDIYVPVGGTSSSRVFIGNASVATLVPLPPGGSNSQPEPGCISNSNGIVGSDINGGWIWSTSAGTRLLNTMVPSGWNISSADSISQNGLIVAVASYNGGAPQFVELIPTTPATPAPAAIFLTAAGLLLLLAWRLRCRLLQQ